MTRFENKTKEQLIKEVLKLQKQLDEEYESGFIWKGKAREEVNKLKQQLADAEDHIDALEIQLREQYQLVDEKDKEIEKYKERVYEHTQPFAGEDDYDDLFNDVLTHGGICAGNWLFYGKYTLSHETWDNGFCHNVLVMNIINDLKTMIKKKDEKIEELKALLNAKEKMKTQSIQGFNKLKQNQAQLAIQELEKVKKNLKQLEINIDNQAGFSQDYKLELKQKSLYKNVYKTIDQQIKELKGE